MRGADPGLTGPPSSEEYNGSSWTTGGNMNSPKFALAGCGTQTAALGFGGRPGPVSNTEQYDGSSWTTTTALNTARSYLGGAGTTTAGFGFWWKYSI